MYVCLSLDNGWVEALVLREKSYSRHRSPRGPDL